MKKYTPEQIVVKLRQADVEQTITHLLSHFDGEMLLTDFTPGHAEDFREHLFDLGLANATTCKRCSRIKHIFASAIEHEHIMANPFSGIPTKGKADTSRQEFINQETIETIIGSCADVDFRLVFALARYAGIRIPSELGIRWNEIDWEARTFVVHSPKTEHHPGKAYRVVPIFAELYPYLKAAYDIRKSGSEFVVGLWPCGRSNLRQKAKRAIEAAGFDVWPKLFTNLRSSRASELVNTHGFSEFTVSNWLGNSTEVLKENYLQAMQADVDRATGKLTPELTHPLTQNLTSIGDPVVIPDVIASSWDKLQEVAKEHILPAIIGILGALNETSTTPKEAVPVSPHTPTGRSQFFANH